MVKLTFEISEEAFELLKEIEKKGSAEYRDTEYESESDFLSSTEFETKLRTLDWFLTRNFNGTFGKAQELYKYGLVESDFVSWYLTYVISDFGKEILEKLKK